ncbi:MAG TPA: NADH-quinone oxidoreductase subunit J [Mycobacteriales bacterium]|jgi:NADH-quinone oxidoreductase subunit J|nr:NADH-quinone oxidoreductase subunit J [Mycobacteriales bacterium]
MLSTVVAAASGAPATTHEAVLFWLLAPIAVAAALGMVLARSAVHAAVLLAVVMLSLAAFYTAENAPFLAVVQVVVYTGAVLMLFLFVLMLIGVDSTDSLIETLRGQRLAAAAIGLAFAILLLAAIDGAIGSFHPKGVAAAEAGKGNVTAIAQDLFSRYVFAFEATSALLITAGLGAMVLAHRERTAARLTQRERMQQRAARGGAAIAPLPGPGVYADHNAIDTPALLPDGRVATLSVPDYLQVSSAQPRHEDPELGA